MTYIHIIRINVIFISLQYYPCGIICTQKSNKEGIKLAIKRHASLLLSQKPEEMQTYKQQIQAKIDNLLENKMNNYSTLII